MKKLIGKTTNKTTKETKAMKLYKGIDPEKKEMIRTLLGKIAGGEVKNFYGTKLYKDATKDLTNDERAVVAYICKKVSLFNVFENMDDLVLTKE